MTGTRVSNDVRAQIAAQIDGIGQRLDRAAPSDLRLELNMVRRVARLHQIAPVLAVTALLDAALARGERGPLVHGGFGVLREAAGSERIDEQAASIFAAACSVRLAGG